MSKYKIFGTTTQELKLPQDKPQYNLDLINSQTIPPEYTFTRNSAGTYVGADGYIKTAAANEPRFDYDPITGEFKGLLVEESRTNLITHSIFNFSGETGYPSGWTQFNPGLIVKLKGQAPDKTDAAMVASQFDNSGGFRPSNLITLPINTDFTVSYYARRPSDYELSLFLSYYPTNGTTKETYKKAIRITNNDVHSPGYFGTSEILTDSWIRYTYTRNSGNDTGLSPNFSAVSTTDPNSYDFTGVFVIACVQVELNSNASSYIPTSGSAVTRQPDQLVLNRPLNLSGTFYFESSISNLKDQQTLLTADNDTDRLVVKNVNGNLYQLVNNLTISSSTSIDTESTKRLITTDFGKYIFTSSSNTESSIHQRIPNYSTTYNNLSLGFDPQNTGRELNGYIKKFSYYPQSISENQSQSLTNDKQPLNYISSLLYGGDDIYQINIDGQNYIVHRFLTTGTSNLIVPINIEVEYLIVGGGGGGGASIGGGGGAGEFIEGSKILSTLTYPVVVGNGGEIATNGENSSAFSITVIGGGRGGTFSVGANGGSGGGGAFNGGGGLSISTIGFGNAGGAGGGSGAGAAGGGGGGAGSIGFDRTVAQNNDGLGGIGGTGKSSTITGATLFYAAGGGGGNNSFSPGALGGSGIGGNGANNLVGSNFSTPGTTNTGSGGGGGGNVTSKIASPGGSGIVIIRYKV